MTATERHNLQIRMDKALHTEVKRVAEIEHRSISAQIHIMLQEALELRKAKAQAKKPPDRVDYTMINKKGVCYEWVFTVDRILLSLAYRARLVINHRFLGNG